MSQTWQVHWSFAENHMDFSNMFWVGQGFSENCTQIFMQTKFKIYQLSYCPDIHFLECQLKIINLFFILWAYNAFTFSKGNSKLVWFFYKMWGVSFLHRYKQYVSTIYVCIDKVEHKTVNTISWVFILASQTIEDRSYILVFILGSKQTLQVILALAQCDFLFT